MNTLWQELFNSLNKADFKRVEHQSTLTLSDIEQEARLLCWQICSGKSNYDSQQGSVQSYIMGKLWGLSYRYAKIFIPGQDDADNSDDSLQSSKIDRLFLKNNEWVEDPLTQLVHHEETRDTEQHQSQMKELIQSTLNEQDKNFLSLSLALDINELANLFTLTPRAIRYKQHNLIKKIHLAQCKNGSLN
ncbi:MAG: hypothetical protein KGQ44_03100 [Betaproteobacteria bacterium]|nr:hypothetical protein [Betaproteobacteria bacterium]